MVSKRRTRFAEVRLCHSEECPESAGLRLSPSCFLRSIFTGSLQGRRKQNRRQSRDLGLLLQAEAIERVSCSPHH